MRFKQLDFKKEHLLGISEIKLMVSFAIRLTEIVHSILRNNNVRTEITYRPKVGEYCRKEY
jgi:hypothetical protein